MVTKTTAYDALDTMAAAVTPPLRRKMNNPITVTAIPRSWGTVAVKGRPAAYTPALMIDEPGEQHGPGKQQAQRRGRPFEGVAVHESEQGPGEHQEAQGHGHGHGRGRPEGADHLGGPLRASPAAAGTTMVANVLASVKTISETFVATEYRPTLAAATKAGSIATSSRPVTWLATVAPWPRSPNQSVLRPSREVDVDRTRSFAPTATSPPTSTSPVAAAGRSGRCAR